MIEAEIPTAFQLVEDGSVALVGFTQRDVARTRQELVDLTATVENRMEELGDPDETTLTAKEQDEYELLEFNQRRYTEAIDTIDRLPQ